MARHSYRLLAASGIAVMLALPAARPLPPARTDPDRRVGTMRTDVCEVQLGGLGIPVTLRGEIRFHFEKTGRIVKVVTSSYRVNEGSPSGSDAPCVAKAHGKKSARRSFVRSSTHARHRRE